MNAVDVIFDPTDFVEVRFVKTWERDGRRFSTPKLTSCNPASAFTPESVAEIADDAKRAGLHIFMGVCPRAPAGGGKSSDIPLARCVWIDLDHVKPEEAAARIAEKKLPRPSLMMDSGHGVHLYWRLTQPVVFSSEEDREAFQSIVRGVGQGVGGDHTHDLARLLRLPGTWNIKRLPYCRTEPVWSGCDPSARYGLDVFRPHAVAKPVGRPHAVKAGGGGEAAVEYKATATWAGLRPRQKETALAAVERSANAPMGTRSDVDYGTLLWLAKLGLPEQVAWSMVEDTGKFAEGGRGYFARTWRNASAVAAAEKDEKRKTTGGEIDFPARSAETARLMAELFDLD